MPSAKIVAVLQLSRILIDDVLLGKTKATEIAMATMITSTT